mgnify:CR=1 FL=1
MMNLDFFDRFADPYLKTPTGRGVFLAGLILGVVASQQSERGSVQDSPLFKQISFGRMQVRDIRRLLSRIPELSKAYGIRNPGRVSRLLAEAGNFLLEGDKKDLGVDGNFTFSVAFSNAWRFYKEIFPDDQTAQKTLETIEVAEEQNIEE